MILQFKARLGMWLKTAWAHPIRRRAVAALKTAWAHPIRRRAVAAGCIAVAFGAGISVMAVHAKHLTHSWMRVYTKGTYVGLVPNRPLVSRTMQTLASGYHLPLQFQVVHQAVSPAYDWHTVASLPTPAEAIIKDGQPLLYTSNEQAAASILKTVKAQLTPKRLPHGATVKFSGHVSIQSAVVGISQILQPASAISILLHPNQGLLTGRSGGDLLASSQGVRDSVATKRSVSDTVRLGAANTPNQAPSKQAQPQLQVVASVIVSRKVSVPYKVQYKNDARLGAGTVRVLRKGKPGRTVEQVELTYVDGQLTQKHVTSKTVVSKPRAEIAERGTNRGIAGGAWTWPVSSRVITSPFGWRILFGAQNFHPGVDIGVPIGTPIYATNNGVVESAGWNSGGYGIWVEVNNGNGIQTIFGHMSHEVVHDGQTVYKGELLGYSGETGLATGPHLHYEVRVHGTPVNPLPKYV